MSVLQLTQVMLIDLVSGLHCSEGLGRLTRECCQFPGKGASITATVSPFFLDTDAY